MAKWDTYTDSDGNQYVRWEGNIDISKGNISKNDPLPSAVFRLDPPPLLSSPNWETIQFGDDEPITTSNTKMAEYEYMRREAEVAYRRGAIDRQQYELFESALLSSRLRSKPLAGSWVESKPEPEPPTGRFSNLDFDQ